MIFQTTNQENACLGNLEIQMQTYLWELQMITAQVAGRTLPLALQVMCKCAGAVSAGVVRGRGTNVGPFQLAEGS